MVLVENGEREYLKRNKVIFHFSLFEIRRHKILAHFKFIAIMREEIFAAISGEQ